MIWLLLLPAALVAGMAAPTQFAINSQLRQVVGGPVLAAAISFLVGTVILIAATAIISRSIPELGSTVSAPWWMYLGGLLGALDRKSTRLNSSHTVISYAVFCLKKKKKLYDVMLVINKQRKE